MAEMTVGFVGAGRVAKIILSGFKKSGRIPKQIIVSDTSADVLKQLKSLFPNIQTVLNNNRQAVSQDLVFLGLHPPALVTALDEIRDNLRSDSILISLAPKLSTAKITEALAGFNRIVRLIPNAASIISEGYNPITFSESLNQDEKDGIRALLNSLGKCPEVPEDELEAYAIITAMGPTYLWFQLQELQKLAESFGMPAADAKRGIEEMVIGSVKTMFESDMAAEEVMDLIPVKPLADEEAKIKAIYREKLGSLYKKLKN